MENRYLFRGKRIDNGEWVVGFYLKPLEEYGNGERVAEIVTLEAIQHFEWVSPTLIVDPSTICQCTGLKDKNGKLIWENDVIRCNYETSIVKWGKSEWRIKWIDEAVWRRDLDYWVNESKREVNVVGNIFDNPELLE